MFQQEKTADNKFFAKFTAEEILTFDALQANSIPISYILMTIPFKSDNCLIDEIIFNKKIKITYTQNQIDVSTYYDQNTIIPVPGMYNHIFAGFSSMNDNASAVDLTSYCQQNYVSIPIVFYNNIKNYYTKTNRNFKFKNNNSFLNCFIYSNYDCGNTDLAEYLLTIAGILNAQSGIAAALKSISIEYSLFMSGLTEQNYNKKD